MSYRVLVQHDPSRNVFVATAPELEHCSAEGATRAEALAKVEEEMTAQLENIKEQGGTPPPALDADAGPAGAVTLALSRGLHRELSWQARVEGVELNQLCAEMLAGALDARRQRAVRRPNPNQQPQQAAAPSGDEGGGNTMQPRRDPQRRDRRGPNDGRYHAIMEDRATFLEYVRGLESGPDRGGGGGGAGGGGRRRGPR